MKRPTASPWSTQIAKFMRPTWGAPGSCRPQMGPMLAPWTLLSGRCSKFTVSPACHNHYGDVTMGTIASQITSLTIVYSTVQSGADQRKYQSSASLAFVRGIPRGPVNSPHKWPVTRKMFPFDDVIMIKHRLGEIFSNVSSGVDVGSCR